MMRMGDRTVPCGAPVLLITLSDAQCCKRTCCGLQVRQLTIQHTTCIAISFSPSMSWSDGVKSTGEVKKHDPHSARLVQMGVGTVQQVNDGILNSPVGACKRTTVGLRVARPWAGADPEHGSPGLHNWDAVSSVTMKELFYLTGTL